MSIDLGKLDEKLKQALENETTESLINFLRGVKMDINAIIKTINNKNFFHILQVETIEYPEFEIYVKYENYLGTLSQNRSDNPDYEGFYQLELAITANKTILTKEMLNELSFIIDLLDKELI